MKILLNLIVVSVVATLIGCASAYKPDEDAVAMSKSMTKQEAVAAISSLFVTKEAGKGVCAANGIPGRSLIDAGWVINREASQSDSNSSEISFDAKRIIASHKVSGTVSTSGSSTYTTTKYSYEDFRRSIKFSDIEAATIYSEVGVLSRVCNFSSNEVEVRMKLATGIGHWFNVVIKKEDLNKFVAAIILLSPDVKLKAS